MFNDVIHNNFMKISENTGDITKVTETRKEKDKETIKVFWALKAPIWKLNDTLGKPNVSEARVITQNTIKELIENNYCIVTESLRASKPMNDKKFKNRLDELCSERKIEDSDDSSKKNKWIIWALTKTGAGDLKPVHEEKELLSNDGSILYGVQQVPKKENEDISIYDNQDLMSGDVN